MKAGFRGGAHRTLVAATALALVIGAGTWLGCGDDSNGGGGGGTTDGSTASDGAGGGNDSGGGGDDSGGGGNDSGGGKDSGTVSCTQYCTQVMTNCKGTIPASADASPTQQYNTMDGCMAECARMAVGSISDQGGQDTVGCRQYHSGAPAVANAALHCPHGGPSGGGVCSGGDAGADRCVTFCKLESRICQVDSGTGVTAGEQPFADEAACLAACGTAPYTWVGGMAELIQGDSTNAPPDTNNLNCRQYHLMAAYNALDAGSAVTHCPHLKVNSAVCK